MSVLIFKKHVTRQHDQTGMQRMQADKLFFQKK